MNKAATPVSSTRAEEALVAAWQSASGRWLNGTNETLHTRRAEAIEAVRGAGLPRERDEAWKYTNIRRLIDEYADRTLEPPGSPPDRATAERLFIPGLDAYRVVVVDGEIVPGLSQTGELEPGLVVTGLAAASAELPEVFNRHFGTARESGRDGLAELNTAFTRDGLFVHAARGAEVRRPIEVLFLSSARDRAVRQPRCLYVADEGSSLRIVEQWRSWGSGRVFTNAVAECIVATGAVMDHVRIVDEADASVHVHHLEAYQHGGSRFDTNTITLGGGTVRNNAYFLPDGEHCETHLLGLYLGRGDAHYDNHTMVDHAKPECFSNEAYKGILDDRSTGVFNGKVLVRQDAQKINAYQSNRNVLLSETARMFSKPELEIYADDVKCSHGATTGQLDDEALFYLRSRGLRPGTARLLMLQAFAGDVIEQIRDESVRAYISNRIADLLHS
jgi:Fe-S cluster assembly protein SufD